MKIQIFTLCDFAQSNAGKLTIIGTFNRIFTDKFPFIYAPSIFVVAKVCSNEACKGQFTFSATAPDGTPFLMPFNGEFHIENPDNDQKEKAFDFCLALNNQVFHKPGTYTFVFEVGDQKATQELYLSLKPAPQKQV